MDTKKFLAFTAILIALVLLPGGKPVGAVTCDFIVNDTSDVVDVNPGNGLCAAESGSCSLRAAVQEANPLTGKSTICLPSGTFTIELADLSEDEALSGDLDITGMLIIESIGTEATIIDGNTLDRVFHILPDAYLELYKVTVSGGGSQAIEYGGGILNEGYLAIGESEIIDNTAAALGGGIYSVGPLTVFDSLIAGNNANKGGGIFSASGGLAIENVTFEKNIAVQGGGLYSRYETIISMSQFLENSADEGAGLVIDGEVTPDDEPVPTLILNSSYVWGNNAGAIGGGIHNLGGKAIIKDSQIIANTAREGGGAITNTLGETTVQTSELLGNTGTFGGAIFINIGEFIIEDSIISDNGSYFGGAIANHGGTLTITDSDLWANHSLYIGGAIFNYGQAVIERSTLYSNKADSLGGAIYNHQSGIPIDVPPINEPLPALRGGPLLLENNYVMLQTSAIGDSEVGEDAIAIYNADLFDVRNSLIESSRFVGNAIINEGQMTFANSIVSPNVQGDPACGGSGVYQSLGHNIEPTDTCGFNALGDMVNTDPMLEIIYEFPWITIYYRSPAVDSSNNELCGTLDISGNSRPVDGTGDGFATCDTGPFELPTPNLIFADIPLNHWAHDFIVKLYEDGYTAGCGTDPIIFCPEQTMTRAESSVFVVRGLHPGEPGYIPTSPSVQIFDDVPVGETEEWFSKWVDELYEQAFTAGCSLDPPLYCPLDGHERAEATVFYLRMLKGSDFVPPAPTAQIFDDVPLVDEGGNPVWYAKWVNAAFEAGIIQECQTDMELMLFRPQDPLTRAEAACMMNMAVTATPN